MRRNPTTTADPRYATTRRIRRPPPKPTSERTTRIYRRNPKRKETPRQQEARLSRWWKQRTTAEKRRLLAMLSPAMCRNPGERSMSKAMRAMARADRVKGRRRKSHVRSYDRWMKKTKRNPKANWPYFTAVEEDAGTDAYDFWLAGGMSPALALSYAIREDQANLAEVTDARALAAMIHIGLVDKMTTTDKARWSRSIGPQWEYLLGKYGTKRNPKAKTTRTPSDRDWRGYKSVKKALKVNPKRDGSPTRGEKRRVKFLSHLKSIQAKGQDAAASIARLTSEVVKTKAADAYAPVGPRATKRVERMDDVDYATKRIEAEGGLDAPVAVTAPEPTEVKFIRSKLEDLDALLKDAQSELKDLDADNDMDADMIAEIHARITDIAKRKRTLQSKLSEMAQTQTNPRRKGKRAMVRIRRSTLLRMDRTVRSLCKAITTLNRAARR